MTSSHYRFSVASKPLGLSSAQVCVDDQVHVDDRDATPLLIRVQERGLA
jgi:hypothetical protein